MFSGISADGLSMTRHFLAVLVLSRLLEAQPSIAKVAIVAPGKQSDIIVAVRSPRVGDMIDILTKNSNRRERVEIFLPDGRELADDAMKQNGFTLSGYLQEDLGAVDPSFQKAFLSGLGDHLVLSFVDKPRGGNYRIRMDNRLGKTPVRVEAAVVRIAGILLDSLQSTPGVKMANVVRVPPGSTGIKLRLALTQSTEESMIDVASTEDSVAIRLRLPDGSIVTQENAKANGLEWEQARYPPNDTGGDDPFGALFAGAYLSAIMLPVDGMHHQIMFPAGIRQAGTYTVEADARRSSATADVSAMFVPLNSASQRIDEGFRRLTAPPVK